MPLRTIASFAVAIFLGLIAVLLVRGVLSGQRSSSGPNSATAPVIAAIAPVGPGVALKPEMVRVVNYPKDAVPTGSFQSMDALFGKNAPPRVVVRAVAQNEPILLSKLSGPGSKATLSAVIQPGMRAVSVRSSDVAGVAGFILPGDKIDVLVTRTVGTGDAAQTITQTLAENALVLGVDQTSDQGSDKPIVAKSVTVEVTPDQAAAISLAQSVGQISLALRQEQDGGPLGRKLTVVADFGPATREGKPGVRKMIKAAPSGPQVHVVRGVESTAYPMGPF